MKLRLGSLEKEVKNLRAEAQKTHSLQVRDQSQNNNGVHLLSHVHRNVRYLP